MKATGIVRRIDDLGRVVIPKEIRRTMRIREGDPLEIFTDREGEVIFKKYSPIGELNSFASQYADTLHRTGELNVIICDRDTVIACAGVPKKEFADRHMSAELEDLINRRALYVKGDDGNKIYPVTSADGTTETYYISCAMPIIAEGDILGCVASLVTDAEGDSGSGKSGQYRGFAEKTDSTEAKLISTAAAFLGKQLETD